MGSNRSVTFATWVGSLATVVAAGIAYRAYSHPPGAPGQQTFSVAVADQDSVAGGRSKETSLDFTVKRCDVEAKQITCFMSVKGPTYDHTLNLYRTQLIDADGDNFRVVNETNLTLDRNHQLPFKLIFTVNKDVARPFTVKMMGNVDYSNLEKEFEVK